jgi:hypothetical protein
MSSIFDVKAMQFRKAQALLAFSMLAGCGGDLSSPNHGIGELQFPSRADFPGVSDAMQLRCGTLDCHGQVGRNLRLYGHYGLRLKDTDTPLDPFMSTEEEYEASYLSVTQLEPEILSKVVKKEAATIDLTFVRKPRGLEHHKGHQLMSQGDSLDRCLVGWLTGSFDADACTAVTTTPKPQPDGGQ